MELGGYRKRINVEEEGQCPRYGEEEETVEHLFVCPAGEKMRRLCGVDRIDDPVRK